MLTASTGAARPPRLPSTPLAFRFAPTPPPRFCRYGHVTSASAHVRLSQHVRPLARPLQHLIVAVPRRLGDAAIDAALEAYSEGRQQMWDQTVGSRRALLELCARHDRTLEALDVLQHMHDDQIEPGMEALDELMRACQRGGDVDESTLQLWLGAAGGDKQGS